MRANMDEKRSNLRQMQLVATGLFVSMAALYAASRSFEASIHSLAYLTAFTEAAMVGALADWFAVVALFRHPLGIPLPHTAIIPRKKNEIGTGLANFVVRNFLTREAVSTKLQEFDLTGIAAEWLTENCVRVAETITGFLPNLLKALHDEDIHRLIHNQLVERLKKLEVAPLAGNLLKIITSGNKHLVVLDEITGLASEMVRKNQRFIRRKIREAVPLPDWPLIKTVKSLIATFIADRAVSKFETFLEEARQTPSHGLRRTFESRLNQLINDLESSPSLKAKCEELKDELLKHPVIGQYAGEVWNDIKKMIVEDVARSNSKIRMRVSSFISGFAMSVLEDKAVRGKLNEWLNDGILDFIDTYKNEAGQTIERTVQRWDSKEVTTKLELEIGRDLQFIRLNGTIIGGLVGLSLHLVSRIIWN